MSEINILVTGAGGGGIGEQVIKALRGGNNQYFIVATDIRVDSVATLLGDVFSTLPPSRDEAYISSIIECSQKYRCKVIIPGSEPELKKIAENIKLFTEKGIYVPINPIELIELCSNKTIFNEFLEQNNFPTCETVSIRGNNVPSKLAKYPYVIKPSSGSGSKDVFVVQTQTELINILAYLGNNNNYILQEYVGTGDEEYTVGILCTPKKGYVKHIILKRDLSLGLSIKQSVVNNTGNTSFGDHLVISTGISQGTFVANPLIDVVVHKIVNLLKPTSTINMQCRVHEGKVYIFEINPRFSGTTNLRAIVGFNEPEYIINEKFLIDNTELVEKSWENQKVLRGIKEYLII